MTTTAQLIGPIRNYSQTPQMEWDFHDTRCIRSLLSFQHIQIDRFTSINSRNTDNTFTQRTRTQKNKFTHTARKADCDPGGDSKLYKAHYVISTDFLFILRSPICNSTTILCETLTRICMELLFNKKHTSIGD